MKSLKLSQNLEPKPPSHPYRLDDSTEQSKNYISKILWYENGIKNNREIMIYKWKHWIYNYKLYLYSGYYYTLFYTGSREYMRSNLRMTNSMKMV